MNCNCMGNFSLNLKLVSSVQWLLIALALFCLLLTQSSIQDFFFFDAQLVADGQWWRPFSAWFTQLNFRHWLLNSWGIILMWLLLPKHLSRRLLLGFLFIWLGASGLLLRSDYSQYVGLSGLLYGWLLWSVYLSPHYAWQVKGLIALFLIVKVGYDQWLVFAAPSSSLAQWLGSDIAYEAHAWGLVMALLVLLCDYAFQRFSSNDARHGSASGDDGE